MALVNSPRAKQLEQRDCGIQEQRGQYKHGRGHIRVNNFQGRDETKL